MFHVDPLATQPIFEQLVHQVKGAIARGELAAGDRLPSIRALAKDVRVNPNTVAKVYDRLERDGVIVRRQGSGSFVRAASNALSETEREARLREMTERTVTEAYHLGFSAEEVRRSITRALDVAQLPRRRRNS